MFPRSSPILLLLVLLAVSTLALLVSLAPSPAAAVPIPAPKKAAGHGHRLAAAVAPEAADVEDVRAEALDFIDRAQAVVEEYADAAGIDVDAADDDDDDDCKEKKKHGIRGFFQLRSAGSSRARGNSSARRSHQNQARRDERLPVGPWLFFPFLSCPVPPSPLALLCFSIFFLFIFSSVSYNALVFFSFPSAFR